MSDLPKLLATSVVRSTCQGESHGGVYLVDLRTGDRDQVVDWNDPGISWEGRGGDRGLRGIAYYGEFILIAASDEVFIYDQEFNVVDSFQNAYLKHCHEVCRAQDILWLTSTGFDSVLGFDLKAGRFRIGYQLIRIYSNDLVRRLNALPRYSLRTFDPERSGGPPGHDTLHVNSIATHEGGSMLLSGTKLRHVLEIGERRFRPYARVPEGTHNAQPFKDGVLANHTATNRLAFLSRRGRVKKSFPIRTYEEGRLMHSSVPADHARQAFGRGLATWEEQIVIGGSSPATISAFDFESGERVACVNITMDVRNAIHGLEVWPF